MTVLRSREIVPSLPVKKTTKKRPKTTQNTSNIEPCTPSQTKEPSPSNHPHPTPMSSGGGPRRRSLRLFGRSIEIPAGSYSESPVTDRRVRRRTSEDSGSVVPEEPRVSVSELEEGKVVERDIKNGVGESGDFGGGGEGKWRSAEESDEKGKGKTTSDTGEEAATVGDGDGGRRFSRKEKGKEIFADDSSEGLEIGGEVEPEEVNNFDNDLVGGPGERDNYHPDYRKERFKEMARRSAHRFAHFTDQDELGVPGGASEIGDHNNRDRDDDELVAEDWPGPFSTALKIIQDRENRIHRVNTMSSSLSSLGKKGKAADVEWVPRSGKGCERSRGLAPSLVELCSKVVVDNADSLVSLDHVPEALRHQMSRMLCDSRRMNAHFFGLLVQGSPMEICLSDCSWLSEDEFTKSCQGFDPSCLLVLKLDQSGRCLPDYVLLSTLARSENFLPVLNTLSLRGACRLSDVGLKALACSAPALQSLNLSQCSLLTSASIDTLAKSFGSNLKELYLEDCQSIDAMLMLPALKKFEQLESLSVAGIETVCDKFICEFVGSRGHNMKELVLTDCINLTDYSLKAIAEKCPGLLAIDLANCKLTDSSLGYLANGCRSIQRLKLCRSPFSDKSIAAFLETSGDCLEELSLNNVREVGCQTAISIARRSGKLRKLDLSWCRDLTDNALGLIVDKCPSLKVLKLFGCSQISDVFFNGHSNLDLKIIGVEMSPVLEYL